MDALLFSKYVINKCYNDKKPISNLKLQKMLYFLFGYYCAKYHEYLFNDDFVAWKLGPVILDVYFNFNNNVSEPICETYNNIDLELSPDRVKFIDEEIEKLQGKSTWNLVEDSHKTEPWKQTYANGAGKGQRIPSYEIEEFFEANNS